MELRAGAAVLIGAEQLAPVDFTSALKNAAKAKPHLYTVSFALERPMINDANGFGY